MVIQETFGRKCAGSGDPRTARSPIGRSSLPWHCLGPS